VLSLYTASLYWSIMTITSIGYGDIVPVNDAERWTACFLMMVSGATWAYVIGQAAAIASTLDPGTVAYRNMMDSLNHFMNDRKLPASMRHAIREYFSDARGVHQVDNDASLLVKMSPMLRGNVALEASKRWLEQVWFLRGMGEVRVERDFVAALAMTVELRAFAIEERLPLGQMYVLRRGMAVLLWRFLGQGRVWGEDMLLDDPELRNHAQAVALTFVEVFVLAEDSLRELGGSYPQAWAKIERAIRKVAVARRLLVRFSHKYTGKPPRSFVPQSAASGYVVVPQAERTLDQKIDQLGESWRKLSGILPVHTSPRRNSAPAGGAQMHGRGFVAPKVPLITVAPADDEPSPRIGASPRDTKTDGELSRSGGGTEAQMLQAVIKMQEALFLSVQAQSQAALDMAEMQRKMQRELQSVSSTVQTLAAGGWRAPAHGRGGSSIEA